MTSLKTGDAIRDLTFTTAQGESVRLRDFRDQQPVVLFFYPKNGTPVCTKEACAFRDAYDDFVKAGAVVIGISGDSEDSHRQFASTHHLPYLLVSDADEQIRRALGVPKSLGILPGRVTYVIDTQGIVQHIFNSQLDADRHVQDALATLRRLDASHEPEV